MKKTLIILIALGISTISLYAQNKTIKGRVIDDALEIMPYVPIMIDDTVKVDKTDTIGFFDIEIPVSVKKISFGTIGMELTNIELTDKCNEVEVVMISRPTYDFISLRKIDKIRMKEFKKLPEIHKQAFEKGLFKTDAACYTQEFIPHYKKKQK